MSDGSVRGVIRLAHKKGALEVEFTHPGQPQTVVIREHSAQDDLAKQVLDDAVRFF